ncbi:MAG: hypothetical protein Q9202_007282 [Teloschistes flavicans]
MAQNFPDQCSVDDTSDTPASSVSTPAPVQTPTSIILSLPQTPQSALHTAPPRVQRPRPQTRFRDLYGNPPYSRYLQTRTAGPRIRLPPVKSSSKQLPTPPAFDDLSTASSQRPLSLLTLPVEIRTMIYHELLVSAQCIRKPHKLVCNKKSIMLDSIKPVRDIDSAVLRVCRSVYNEALPILYGKNTFEFCKPRKLRDFSHAGLDRRITNWQLSAQDAIRVDPFIAKFGRSPGLSSAVIKGVLNRTNLDEFRTGLVKPGGTFTIKP